MVGSINDAMTTSSEYLNARRLFVGSCLTMSVSGLTFAIRAEIIGELGKQFALSHEQLGWIAGAAFWGFVLSMLVAGQLCDWLGMGKLLGGGCVFHTLGVLLTIGATGFWSLWAGTLCLGMGNALVEAAINPLVATLYRAQKTEKLNAVHAWFPGGIVMGGLVAYLFTSLHLGWQAKTCLILIPTLAYGAAFFRQPFPRTERVEQGVPVSIMYREALRPRFLLWIGCMLLTASTELGPNQWIPDILSKTAQFPGILVLVWINGLMAGGRLLAGKPVEKLSPLGVLIGAAVLSAVGLVSLSAANSAVTAILASTIFAVGVCYFWPTMLGVTAEWFPKGGALLLAVIGGAGNLSVALILPVMGRIYDVDGPSVALRRVVVLPLALVVVFIAIWLYDRRVPRRSAP
jgi:MFS family permease